MSMKKVQFDQSQLDSITDRVLAYQPPKKKDKTFSKDARKEFPGGLKNKDDTRLERR